MAPEKLENIYAKINQIAQIYVHGDSLRSELVAIVVPEVDEFVPWAKNHVGAASDDDSIKREGHELLVYLSGHPAVYAAMLDELTAKAKEERLMKFEYVKAIKLHLEPFSVDNDLLTPT